jgi:hypothetical protein
LFDTENTIYKAYCRVLEILLPPHLIVAVMKAVEFVAWSVRWVLPRPRVFLPPPPLSSSPLKKSQNPPLPPSVVIAEIWGIQHHRSLDLSSRGRFAKINRPSIFSPSLGYGEKSGQNDPTSDEILVIIENHPELEKGTRELKRLTILVP